MLLLMGLKVLLDLRPGKVLSLECVGRMQQQGHRYKEMHFNVFRAVSHSKISKSPKQENVLLKSLSVWKGLGGCI